MKNILFVHKAEEYFSFVLKNMEKFSLKKKEEIDKIFRKKDLKNFKDKSEFNFFKRKSLEISKIEIFNFEIFKKLNEIVKKFFKLENLSKFEIGLIKTYFDTIEKLDEFIFEISKIINKIDEISQNSIFKMKRTKKNTSLNFIFKKYLGKVSSLLKKNSFIFDNLIYIRKIVLKLPRILDILTFPFCGFPNVGKSTLMKKICESELEIQPFPFTTKNISLGYLRFNNQKIIQLIDTPGVLNRNKENEIEKRASLILKFFNFYLVFVLDITESCGYKIEKQIEFFTKLKKENPKSKFIIYFSKKDLFKEKEEKLEKELSLNEFKNCEKIFNESSNLKKYMIDIYNKKIKLKTERITRF